MQNENVPQKVVERHKEENDAFNNYKEELKKHCAETKELFLKTEPFSLKDNIYGINFLTIIYFDTSFYPDQEIFDKFLSFGVKKKELRWMDGIAEYERQFNLLEEKKIIIYKNEFMRFLHTYLAAQITNDVAEWGEVSDMKAGDSMKTKFLNELFKAINRFKYKAKRKYKPEPNKEVMNQMVQELIESASSAGISIANVKRMARGKIEKNFFTDWIYVSFPYFEKVLRSDEFLIRVMPLFQLILKNDPLPELENFTEDQYLGKDIETIKAHYLRKWIYKE